LYSLSARRGRRDAVTEEGPCRGLKSTTLKKLTKEMAQNGKEEKKGVLMGTTRKRLSDPGRKNLKKAQHFSANKKGLSRACVFQFLKELLWKGKKSPSGNRGGEGGGLVMPGAVPRKEIYSKSKGWRHSWCDTLLKKKGSKSKKPKKRG